MDKIVERIYVKGVLEVASPLIIGSGADDRADIEAIRDWNDRPFIPGTSLVGAIRHYLAEIDVDQHAANLLFGQQVELEKKQRQTTQSLACVYDAMPIAPDVRMGVRDGVALNPDTKTAKDRAKYDYEIIARGEQFKFRLEVAFRQSHDNSEAMKTVLWKLLHLMKEGHIAFGAKTRRGFGTLRLCGEKVLTFDMNKPDHVRHWIVFTWDDQDFAAAEPVKNSIEILTSPGTHIIATFAIPYSILIRSYNSNPSDPDTSHLTTYIPASGNEEGTMQPIIPGTSWNGALRGAMHHIIQEILQREKKTEAEIEAKRQEIFDSLFGYVDEKKQKKPNVKASRITIRESVIEGGQLLRYTRNKIDRFTGGVVDSALFDEQAHYGGTVTLELTVKDADKYPEGTRGWEIGLLLLALKDIGNGIQPVGGAANIGRGILRQTKISITDEKPYLQALATYLNKEPEA